MKNTFSYDGQLKKYPLTPSQQTMYFMIKYSLHKQVIQIPSSFAVRGELDFKLLARALNIEIERNDCLRLRFVKDGGDIKQYFLPEFKLDGVRCFDFRSEDERDTFFDNDAATPVRFLKDETFRVCFFSCGEKRGVYLNVCHMVMDALAVSVFYRDLFAVYDSLKNGVPMPPPLACFEEYIETELAYLKSPRFASDAEAASAYHRRGGMPYYCGIHGPQLLRSQRVKKSDPSLTIPSAYDPIHDGSRLYRARIEPRQSAEMLDFCKENAVAPETLLQCGFRLHASHINGDINDTFMMVLCGRRVTKKERNMGGCLAQPFMTRVKYTSGTTFMQLLKDCTAVRSELFRHKDFPYLSSRRIQQDLYGLSASQGPSFMMFTWLPLDTHMQGAEFKGYNLGRYVMPMYAFSYIAQDGGIDIVYMYRTNLISDTDVFALHENAVKYITAGIASPDISVRELCADR